MFIICMYNSHGFRSMGSLAAACSLHTPYCKSRISTTSHVSVLQVMYQYYKSCISTTSHVSVLQVTYQYYKSCISTISHVSVLQVTYQYYKSRISTTSHVSVLQVMQLRRIITYKTIKENSHWIHR